MKYHKTLNRLISLLCAVSLLFSVCSIPTFAVTVNEVTATTNTTVKQGNTAYCYVYIDSTKSLAALDVTVHFDNTKVKISNVYNSISCTLYDSVTNESDIQFSYIFDGEGTASKTQLFYFTYQVLSNAEVGDAYFDITIGEAYDNSLNDVEISGSRCNFTIAETVTAKSCSVYSTGTVSTSVEEEFSLSYRFSTYQIASGSAVITYDSELFEVVDVTNGDFLSNKVTDVNTNLKGSIYISFVGTAYNNNTNFITVKFRTLKNVAETSTISFKTTELYDVDLNAISCSGYTTTATVVYDDTYVGDAPKMSVNAEFGEDAEQVTAVIRLEENSKLGAGDFVLIFDPALLTLSSYEKGFEPGFFNINDKEAADGIFKFSVISLDDIVSEETVITIVFDAQQACTEQIVSLDISGSMLTDSLTNTIVLNLVDGNVNIPEKHTYSSDCDAVCNLCGFVRSTSVSHSFSHTEDTACNNCEHIRVLESIAITSTPDKSDYLEGKDVLDVSGGSLTLYYNDGTSGVVEILSDMVSGFDNTVVGSQTLIVAYGGFNDTYDIEIVAKSLESIEVTTLPTKTEYLEIKDKLDLSGGKITLYYNNGSSREIDLSESTVSGFNNTIIGTNTITVVYDGKTTMFNVEIIAKSLVSISVATKPSKLTYLEGDSFDGTGMVVTANYNNGTSEVITGYELTGFTSTPGVNTIAVSYLNKITTFTVNVNAKSMTEIVVSAKPTKLVYLEGDAFNADGMKVIARYDNNTESEITDYTVSGYDSTPGTKLITVSYNGFEAQFTVEVENRSMTGIEITNKPTKLTYLEGDEFDYAGMTVTALYDNGTSETVTDYTVSGYDSTPGSKTITVTYNGFKATFTVQVQAKSLTEIVITATPAKTEYIEGQILDTAGLVVTANYNNGTSEEITNYSLSGYKNTVGTHTVTVTYGGKTATFDVRVIARVVTTIEVTKMPNKVEYLEGDEIALTGLEVTATYNDGTTEKVTDYICNGYDSTPGEKTVSVMYSGCTASFIVNVKAKSFTHITITYPTKLTYFVGEELDTAGMTVTAFYDNGTSEVIEIGKYAIEGFDSSAVGTKDVTVSYNGKTQTFSVTIVEAPVTIVYGDVNGDGKINLTDVSLILKHIAKWDIEMDTDAADVNCDGKINLTDVSTILKYIAKWDVVLGGDKIN